MSTLPPRQICDGPTCTAAIYRLPNDTTGMIGPVDAVPMPDGNVVLIEGADGRWRYHVLGKADFTGDVLTGDPPLSAQPRYLNHWITCPDAEWFRERASKRRAK